MIKAAKFGHLCPKCGVSLITGQPLVKDKARYTCLPCLGNTGIKIPLPHRFWDDYCDEVRRIASGLADG